MKQRPPLVFISYSHDSLEHQERVLALADRLRAAVSTPRSISTTPRRRRAGRCGASGKCRRRADGLYRDLSRRIRGDEEQGKGLGVVWEARIIRQLLYDAGAISDKFVPVLFSDASAEQIPTPIKVWPRYVVDTEAGYEELYRRLTGQPRLLRPALGTIRPLPTRRRQWSEGTMEAASSSLNPREMAEGRGRLEPVSSNQEADMGEKTGQGQSGGVNIALPGQIQKRIPAAQSAPQRLFPGTVGSIGGDIVGRDKIVGVPPQPRWMAHSVR